MRKVFGQCRWAVLTVSGNKVIKIMFKCFLAVFLCDGSSSAELIPLNCSRVTLKSSNACSLTTLLLWVDLCQRTWKDLRPSPLYIC